MDKGVGKHQKVRSVTAKTEIRDHSIVGNNLCLSSNMGPVSNGGNGEDKPECDRGLMISVLEDSMLISGLSLFPQ